APSTVGAREAGLVLPSLRPASSGPPLRSPPTRRFKLGIRPYDECTKPSQGDEGGRAWRRLPAGSYTAPTGCDASPSRSDRCPATPSRSSRPTQRRGELEQ